MNYTKKQLQEAILTIAKEYDQEKSYLAIMSMYPGMPKIVEMISYLMFLKQFDSRSCTDKLYKAYNIIFEYATELDKNGFVDIK